MKPTPVIPTSARLRRGLTRTLRAWVASLTLIVAFCTAGALRAHGQAKITSPPPGSTISSSFTVTWSNVGASQYWLYLGSQQGGYDYYSGSMGTNTRAPFSSSNPPPSIWVRLWSYYPAYGRWLWTDAFYQITRSSGGGTASGQLIEAFINAALSHDGQTTGSASLECKGWLQAQFNSVSSNYRLPNGSTPVMPPNGPADWQWNVANYTSTSAFGTAAVASPSSSVQSRLNDMSALLRQVKRGDCLQCVWRNGTTVILHTLLFTKEYQQGQDFEWVAANEKKDANGIPIITWGNYFGWGEEKTWTAVIDRLTRYPACGATLYRLRSDISRR